MSALLGWCVNTIRLSWHCFPCSYSLVAWASHRILDNLFCQASQSNLIVEICCAENREESLKEICEGIDSCEKALNEYLEQKKKARRRII